MVLKWIQRACAGQKDPRNGMGKAASLVGVCVNMLLFAGKLIAGLLGGSMAIMADAFNNMTDASSSVVSLLGFKLADKPADAEHPYGHGRYEYLSALVVAAMVMVIGVELLQSSIERITSPQPVAFGALQLAVLVGSILGKMWLAAFNRSAGKKIGSAALLAAADDSRNDVISTGAVLIGAVITRMTGLTLDGVLGAGVAIFILFSGFNLIRETINPLLGSAPDGELVERIRSHILTYPGVLGMHDLIVHDYGPGRQFASVHVEMSANEDPLVSHDVIDNIERDLLQKEKLHLVVHYDPIAVDDPRLPLMRAFVSEQAMHIHPEITIHDLRLVPGASHTNVVFDCVVPFGGSIDARIVKERIAAAVAQKYPDHFCVITIERSFVNGH